MTKFCQRCMQQCHHEKSQFCTVPSSPTNLTKQGLLAVCAEWSALRTSMHYLWQCAIPVPGQLQYPGYTTAAVILHCHLSANIKQYSYFYLAYGGLVETVHPTYSELLPSCPKTRLPKLASRCKSHLANKLTMSGWLIKELTLRGVGDSRRG